MVTHGFFRGMAAAGRLHPAARPARHGVTVERDVPYLDDGRREHLLDVYRPSERPGPHPVVLYAHGGGFRILSKDTHWVMGLAFARHGAVVFNVNYRLAPAHKYPAALVDLCAAYEWVIANAARFGGDPARLVVAGESAGANLVTCLTVAACWPRPEPWARRVFDLGVVPRALLPACGILQVSDTARFRRRKPRLPTWLDDRLWEVEDAYLGGVRESERELADPVVFLERAPPPVRRLPPLLAPVGTRDILLDDTRRLVAAVRRLGGTSEAAYYPGEAHAFHAMVLRPAARRCWQQMLAFVERHAGQAGVRSGGDGASTAAAG
jgi:acetyl esterase